MACCFCSYGRVPSTSSTSGETSSNTDYISLSEFVLEKQAIRREIAHVKTTDIVQNEQIEELQSRVKVLQEIMLKVLTWVDHTCGHCSYSPASGNGAAEKPKIIQRFLPFDLYRTYLLGDPENDVDGDPKRKGYRTDSEVDSKYDLKPAAIATHLPDQASGENDRYQDRKDVIAMFIGVGNESGSGQSDLDELVDAVDGGGEDANYALELLISMYSQSIGGTTEATDDQEDDG